MATQIAVIYSDALGSQIGITWDDVALTASEVTAHIPADAQSVTTTAVVNGITHVVTCPPGTDRSFVFPSALPVVMFTNRKGNVVPTFPWLTTISFTGP